MKMHLVPVLIPNDELRKALKVLEANPETPFVAFYNYEVGESKEVKASGEFLAKAALDVESMMNGTHPIFNKEYLQKKLEQIKKECAELDIEMANRPMHEVLIELNAKRKQQKLTPSKRE